VPRSQLGVATSLNQFSRSIGGAVGIAVMGAVLSAGLASHLNEAARSSNGVLTTERASELSANPNALIEPSARASLPAGVLDALQGSMAAAIHSVFWVATALAACALIASLWLPRTGDAAYNPPPEDACSTTSGERMMMAELTTLGPEDEPIAARGD
jgi:hypothetical protein